MGTGYVQGDAVSSVGGSVYTSCYKSAVMRDTTGHHELLQKSEIFVIITINSSSIILFVTLLQDTENLTHF